MEQPPWWAYSILSLLIFVGLLILNLIVNKINAARIEEKFALMMAKAGNNYPEQATLNEVDNPANNHPEQATLKEVDNPANNHPEQATLKEVDNPANNHPEQATLSSHPANTKCDTRFKTIDATPVSGIVVNVTERCEVNQYRTIDGTTVNITALNEPREISIIGRNITMEGGTIEGRTEEGSTVEGRTLEGRTMEGSAEPRTDGENTEPAPNK